KYALLGMPRHDRRPARCPASQKIGRREQLQPALIVALAMTAAAARGEQGAHFRFEDLVTRFVTPGGQRTQEQQSAGNQDAFSVGSHVGKIRLQSKALR